MRASSTRCQIAGPRRARVRRTTGKQRVSVASDKFYWHWPKNFATKGYLFLALLLLKQKRFAEAVDVLSTLYRRNPFLQDETKYLVLEYLRLGYSGLGDRKHMAEIGETMSHLRPDEIVHKRFDYGREI